MKPTLSVVIPVYNEVEFVETLVQKVLAAVPEIEKEILLVDDGSTDGTRDLLKKMEDLPRIRVKLHEKSQGKGAALRTGFDMAQGEIVVIQDADLEYDPADYHRLMAPVLRGDVEVVIGSRWGEHRPVAGVKGRLHAWGNGVLTRLSNAMTGYDLHDMESCYKLMTIGMLRRLRPFLTESRYGVEPQMVATFSSMGAAIVEVSIRYQPRGFSDGKKIGWRDGLGAIRCIVKYNLFR